MTLQDLVAKIKEATGPSPSAASSTSATLSFSLPPLSVDQSKCTLASLIHHPADQLLGTDFYELKSALEAFLQSGEHNLSNADSRKVLQSLASLPHRAQSFRSAKEDLEVYNRWESEKNEKEHECNVSIDGLNTVEERLQSLAKEEADLEAKLRDVRLQKGELGNHRQQLMGLSSAVLNAFQNLKAQADVMEAKKLAAESDQSLILEAIDQLKAILIPVLPALPGDSSPVGEKSAAADVGEKASVGSEGAASPSLLSTDLSKGSPLS